MEDFYQVFGTYPKTIGALVLDSVTVDYAVEHYGVVGAAICRDQMDTDGFTLWGGIPNGFYYPSKKNAFLPAQTKEEQINAPMIRLLGPDPIYNFETNVREDLRSVYTLETVWPTGRDPKWLSWFFGCLTEEDVLGVGYAQMGQENNFLWENIEPGLGPQLTMLEKLAKEGKIRVETMAQSAKWFKEQYEMTPPLSFQASNDWKENSDLSVQWYASANYRIGFLGEEGHLRIRDMFLYDEVINLPKGPQEREITKTDVVFQVKETIGAFRIVAHRYELMPDWCFYRGTPIVFTMADNLIVIPE